MEATIYQEYEDRIFCLKLQSAQFIDHFIQIKRVEKPCHLHLLRVM